MKLLLSKTLKTLMGWSPASANQKVLASGLTIGGLLLITKSFAFVKEILVARYFGVSDSIDAFVIAFVFVTFVVNIVSNSFNSAIIPVYVKSRLSNLSEANQLFSNIIYLSVLLLLCMTLFAYIFSEVALNILVAGFSEVKQKLVKNLMVSMLPLIVLVGIRNVWASVLNAGENFFSTFSVQLMQPLFVIVFIVFFSEGLGIYALPSGLVIGSTIECIFLSFTLRKQGLPIFPSWVGVSPYVSNLVKQYMPMVASAIVLNVSTLINHSMAASLGDGSVSTLNYGSKFVYLINGMGIMVIGTIVFPYFSKMVTKKDWCGLQRTWGSYSRFLLVLLIPFMLVLIYGADMIISVVYEGGEFKEEATTAVVLVHKMLVLQIPLQIAGTLNARVLSALGRNHILLGVTVGMLLVNVLGNYVLMDVMGISGIALAWSITFAFSYAVTFFYLRYNLKKLISGVRFYEARKDVGLLPK